MVRTGEGAMQPAPSHERIERLSSGEHNARNIADAFVEVRWRGLEGVSSAGRACECVCIASRLGEAMRACAVALGALVPAAAGCVHRR